MSTSTGTTGAPRRRAVAALLSCLALACGAGPSGVAPSSEAPGAPAGALEDALPTYFEHDEVDVAARPLAPIRPDYPPRLRALGVEGAVDARVVVLADGSAGPARLVASTHEAFTAAFDVALRETRFDPARRDGRAVASWLTVRVNFTLDDAGEPTP